MLQTPSPPKVHFHAAAITSATVKTPPFGPAGTDLACIRYADAVK